MLTSTLCDISPKNNFARSALDFSSNLKYLVGANTFPIQFNEIVELLVGESD